MKKVSHPWGQYLLFCCALILAWRIALADGFMLAKYYASKSIPALPLVEEKGQLAYIDYDGKIEKLIISVTTEWRAKNAFWLFPVPSSPDSLHLKVLAILPEFQGDDIISTAKEVLENTRNSLLISQIYTLPLIAFYRSKQIERELAFVPGAGTIRPGAKAPPLIVHEHIEKGGMVVEKITARYPRALYDYLRKKGFRINEGAIPVIDYYIGKDYTFIVAWLAKTHTEEAKAQGIYVEFPTARIYYPLLPTSIYGAKVIPAKIYLMGLYTPEITPNLKPLTKITHCFGRYSVSSIVFYFSHSEREKIKEDIELIEDFLKGRESKGE
ncbi:DUF2330 domain-containing protein [bacterium]|nr:DUF2330 domain-containing protein [bacterium]